MTDQLPLVVTSRHIFVNLSQKSSLPPDGAVELDTSASNYPRVPELGDKKGAGKAVSHWVRQPGCSPYYAGPSQFLQHVRSNAATRSTFFGCILALAASVSCPI